MARQFWTVTDSLTGFNEKTEDAKGRTINGGIYLMRAAAAG